MPEVGCPTPGLLITYSSLSAFGSSGWYTPAQQAEADAINAKNVNTDTPTVAININNLFFTVFHLPVTNLVVFFISTSNPLMIR